MSNEPGRKNDAGKLDWSILQLDLLEDTIRVLMFGETKYDRENYKHVTPTRRYWSAFLRHAVLYRAGEQFDQETGISHLGHMVASLLFLTWFEKRGEFNPAKLSEALPKPQQDHQESASLQKEFLDQTKRWGAGTTDVTTLPLVDWQKTVDEILAQLGSSRSEEPSPKDAAPRITLGKAILPPPPFEAAPSADTVRQEGRRAVQEMQKELDRLRELWKVSR